MTSLYIQHIKDFSTCQNKINNIDNENTYGNPNAGLSISGYFWGLRENQLESRKKNVSYVQNIKPNNYHKELFNKLELNSYLLLGCKNEGFTLFKIKGKFIHQDNEENLFDNKFYFCFLLQKINLEINDQDLLTFIEKKNLCRQSITNISSNYNKSGEDLIEFINSINFVNLLNV